LGYRQAGQPPLSLVKIINTDVFVLGAGAAGFGACYALTKNKIHCVCADINPGFGGNAVYSGVCCFEPGFSLRGVHTRLAEILLENGGKTPVAGMVHDIVLLLVLLVLMPLAETIPMPCIAAILFVVAYNMSEWRKFVSICKTGTICKILVLFVTFALTIIFDLIVAIIIGMCLYYILFFTEKLITRKSE